MNVLRCVVIASACCCCLLDGVLSVSHTQQVIRTYVDPWLSSSPSGEFAWLGDIDGDAIGDLIVGDLKYDNGTLSDAGRVRVLSGATGADLYVYVGAGKSYFLGISVAGVGDMSGDGVQDFFMTEARLGANSFIHSGTDGTLLHTSSGAGTVLGLGDVNGDGLDDIVRTGPFVAGGGAGLVLGGTFETLYAIPTPPESEFWATSGATIGDIDGDGVTDFVFGAPGEDIDTTCILGGAYVYSGATGALVHHLLGPAFDSQFGTAVAGLDDVTGDRVPDIAVSAPRCCPVMCDLSGLGRISSFHGGTAQKIADRDGVLPEWQLGRVLTNVGDLNGNGFEDLLVQFQDAFTLQGLVSTLDGQGLSGIYSVPNPTSPTFLNFFEVMEDLGDIDSDDCPDFALAVPAGNQIIVYSGAPIGMSTFGEGCAPVGREIPRIGASGVPRIGTDFTSYLSRVESELRAHLIVGLSNTDWNGLGLPLDLGIFGLPGCSLLISVETLVSTETQAVRSGEGVAEVSFTIPADAALIGGSIYLQWVVDLGLDQSPRFAFTRGHQLTFQP